MRRFTLVSALLGTLAFAAGARATTVADMPLEQLARISPLVVHARVESRTSFWSEDGRRDIVTRTTLRVLRTIKGETGPIVSVRQHGGALDGIAMAVPGDASFEVGEEVVVFLQPHPVASGEHVLAAMSAAKFTVKQGENGPIAVRDVQDLTFASPGPDGRLRPSPVQPPTTFRFEDLVRAVRTARPAR